MIICRSVLGEYAEIEALYMEAAEHQFNCSGMCWNTRDIGKVADDILNGDHYTLRHRKHFVAAFTMNDRPIPAWEAVREVPALYLRRIIVTPCFRGKGIMDRIIGLGRLQASYQGLSSLRLETWGDNQRLLSHYGGLGFGLSHVFKAGAGQKLYPVGTSIALMEMEVGKDERENEWLNFNFFENEKSTV